MPGIGLPRAALIKVAGNFHHLDAHARQTMIAAAAAHHATGAPIACTTSSARRRPTWRSCSAAAPGARGQGDPRSPEPAARCLPAAAGGQTGAFLACDGPSRANHATDWRLVECLAELVRHGHEDQILIGGDTTTAAARCSTGGGPGLPYLLRVLRPRLAAELGEEVAAKFFTANPARAFSWA